MASSIIDISNDVVIANHHMVLRKHKEFLEAKIKVEHNTISQDEFDNIIRDLTRSVSDYDNSIKVRDSIYSR